MTQAETDIIKLLAQWRDQGFSYGLIGQIIAAWYRRAASRGPFAGIAGLTEANKEIIALLGQISGH